MAKFNSPHFLIAPLLLILDQATATNGIFDLFIYLAIHYAFENAHLDKVRVIFDEENYYRIGYLLLEAIRKCVEFRVALFF